jgi:hypothetical protein
MAQIVSASSMLEFGFSCCKGKGVVEVSGIHRLNPTIDSGLFTIDQFVL